MEGVRPGVRDAVAPQRRLERIAPLPRPALPLPPGRHHDVGGRRVAPLSREVVRRHPADGPVVRGADDAVAPLRRAVRLAEQDARNGAPLQPAEDVPVVDVADDREGAPAEVRVDEDVPEVALVAHHLDAPDPSLARLAKRALREAALALVLAAHEEDPRVLRRPARSGGLGFVIIVPLHAPHSTKPSPSAASEFAVRSRAPCAI